MKSLPPFLFSQRGAATILLTVCSILATCRQGEAQDHFEPRGVHGGLVVQLGGGSMERVTGFSGSGRYLIEVLDSDADRIAKIRRSLQEGNRYGLIAARWHREGQPLPYAENLVNLVEVQQADAPLAEIFRVLVPGGVVTGPTLHREKLEAAGFDVLATESDTGESSFVAARKPWPEDMDSWSHPRHDCGWQLRFPVTPQWGPRIGVALGCRSDVRGRGTGHCGWAKFLWRNSCA